MNILLSHGSPDDTHRKAVEILASGVSGHLGQPVSAAFLGEALPSGAKVLPMFLTQGGHLRTDVPAMMHAAGAHLLRGPVDAAAEFADMALELAVAARQKQRAVMFALYRLSGAQGLMTGLYERSRVFALPAVAGLYGQCDAATVLSLWSREGLKEALIQPVLMFPGHSMEALHRIAHDSGMHIAIGPALCEHPRIAAWLAERFREAV